MSVSHVHIPRRAFLIATSPRVLERFREVALVVLMRRVLTLTPVAYTGDSVIGCHPGGIMEIVWVNCRDGGGGGRRGDGVGVCCW